MAIDLNSRLARASGIDDAHLEVWMRYCRADDKEKAPAKEGVFNIEGPILQSGYEEFSEKGLTTPSMLRAFLDENKGKNIEVQINSPGGSVFEANAMWSDLARHDGDVRVVVTGACFSAAADFLTLPDAERIAMPGSMFMIHNAFTIAVGDSKTFVKVAKRLEKMNGQCADRMAKAWDIEKKDLVAMMDEETWFTEKEAADAGLVDRVWEDEKNAESEEDSDATKRAIERGTEAVCSRLMAII